VIQTPASAEWQSSLRQIVNNGTTDRFSFKSKFDE
jgi:hypothetical protein